MINGGKVKSNYNIIHQLMARMSVCFLPNFNSSCVKEKGTFRYIEPITLSCNISDKLLHDIVMNLLFKCYKLNTYGYNKISHEYWGKKITKGVCLFHFTMKIVSNGDDQSCISIVPVVGYDSEIHKLYINIVNYIQIFETTIFCKNFMKNK